MTYYSFNDNIRSSLPKQYLVNPDKFVFPFEIKEPNKVRTIITYNSDNNLGLVLRKTHERINDFIKENFSERNIHSFAYHKGVRCLDALEDHLKSNHFIKIDIHHFFESITEENFFKHYGCHFNKNWKERLTNKLHEIVKVKKTNADEPTFVADKKLENIIC